MLSSAPGWKAGGWPAWDSTDPTPRPCPACGTEMEVLLTVATFEEGDDEGRAWFPSEAPAAEPSSRSEHFIDPNQPTAVQIGRSYRQQLYVCPAASEHPHIELCSPSPSCGLRRLRCRRLRRWQRYPTFLGNTFEPPHQTR
jgi:hypothetical protein